MPQLFTKKTNPIILNKALGMNDQVSLVKLDPGFVFFGINLQASNDCYKRREGRDFSFLGPGLCLYVGQIAWDDGVVTEIAEFGGTFYDMSISFTKLMANGARLIIQSPDLNYWSLFDSVNAVINPIVVAPPGAAAQASNLTIGMGETFGFILPGGNVTGLLCDQTHNGWYLQGYGPSFATTTYSADLVFTIASGFSFRMVDNFTNTFQFKISNDGNLFVQTI